MILKILISVLVTLATAVAADGGFCRNLSVPFANALADSQLMAGDLAFSSTDSGSSAYVTVLNRTSKSISRISLLLELQDDKGQFLASVPMSAATRELAGQASESIRGVTVKLLENPVAPSERVQLGGASEMSALSCPHQASTTFVELKFADGSSYVNSTPGWKLTGYVRAVSPLRLDTFPGTLPYQGLVKVQLDSNGRILEIKPATKDTKIAGWLREQLAQWSFLPSAIEGRPVTSELNMLVALHGVGQAARRSDAEALIGNTGVIVIDVGFRTRTEPNEAIYAGGVPMLMPTNNQAAVPCLPPKCTPIN